MKKPFIAGNWKMYKTISEAVNLANGIKRELSDCNEAEIVLCPTFTALASVSDVISSTNIKLGAQNLFWEDEGAFTGEISAPMIKDCGCKYVIIGHSERRKYFSETDSTVNKRIQAALKGGLNPIVCVGETLEERNSGKTLEVVSKQVKGALLGFSTDQLKEMVIAYEPVWAIGTGVNATPDQAQEVHKYIRELIADIYSQDVALDLIILYGGSVKPDNIESLINEKDIDGALIGGASLKADSFIEIVKKSII